MSDDAPETFAVTVIPLLREYTEKLRQWETAAVTKRLPEDAKHRDAYLKDLFQRFRPAAQFLAQQVSGMIDQGKITPLERAELRLRLAEFEAALLSFQRVLANPVSNLKTA